MSRLAGLRVLIVEDSPVVAVACEEMLTDLGCVVVGPASNMAAALEMSEEPLDAAIVDINIRGGKAFSVLRALDSRGVPFLLTSGYADWSMPEEWEDRPRIAKPYSQEPLADALAAMLESG